MVFLIWIITAFKRPYLPMYPIVSHTCACVGCCARLPEVLSPFVSHCLPIYICLCWTVYPISQGLVSPSFLFFFYMCACNILCWMVRPPSRGFVSLVSQLVSQLVFLLVSQLVSQFVCFLISLCGGWFDFAFCSNNELIGVLNAFLRCPPWCWTVCPPARGLVSYLISQLVSLLVSLYGGWSHFAFFPKKCAIKGP